MHRPHLSRLQFLSLLFLAAPALITGCRTTHGTAGPPPVPQPGKAVIVFYAVHGGTHNIDKLKVDGQFIHRFSPGYYFSAQVNPGAHRLTHGIGVRWDNKDIHVQAGQTYYVCSEITGNLLTFGPRLIFVDPMEGREVVHKLRRWED